MKKICIIPARMGSTRFPGKPLATAFNIPLIVHVAKRCALSLNLDHIMVATCDLEIKTVCENYNIPVIMTSDQHERCTDRVSEAIEKSDYNLKDDDFVLMVQGDEILVTPIMIDAVIQEYKASLSPVINLLSTIYTDQDHEDPNVVKVVSTPQHKALYFSRAPIPSKYRGGDSHLSIYQQTGVIGFARKFLREFSMLPQTPLEKIESIDMLRVLENNIPLKVVYTDKETIAVDVPSDLQRAKEFLKNDLFIKSYA